MAPEAPDNFVALIEDAAVQMKRQGAPRTPSLPGDSLPGTEAVLRELLDDSHQRLRELSRSLHGLKDYLTL